MTSRSNPFEELERMFERMSRQFEDASRSWTGQKPLAAWEGEEDAMAMDLVEHDDQYVVTLDLPGFEREDVDVRVTDHTLRISAEREVESQDESAEYIRRERTNRSASRSIRLPEEVNTGDVSAKMRNGVLTVSIPRLDVEESREIEIE